MKIEIKEFTPVSMQERRVPVFGKAERYARWCGRSLTQRMGELLPDFLPQIVLKAPSGA